MVNEYYKVGEWFDMAKRVAMKKRPWTKKKTIGLITGVIVGFIVGYLIFLLFKV